MANNNNRRNRRNLSLMMLVLAVVIVVLYNLPGARKPGEVRPGPLVLPAQQTPEQKAAGNQELTAPALIAKTPETTHHIHIQSWETPHGARVLFVQAPQIPMLDVRVVFNAGAARDGDLPGLASLTSAMLTEGAGVMDVDDIARRFESLGAILDNNSYRDMAIVSLRTLSDAKYRDPALSLFYDVVAHPTFPQASLDRLRNQMLLGLQQDKQNPGTQAAKKFYSTLYQDAPYGTPPDGTEDSLPRITRDQLVAFHQRYYVDHNMVIAMIGDIDRTEAELIALQMDKQLPEGTAAPQLPSPVPLTDTKTVHVEFPSTQTHILVGSVGVKRGDPDWFSLYVGNEILGGGGFASRLNQIIRQDHGLAYSVYSQFIPMAVEGPFIMGVQTRNEKAGEALKLLDKTLRDFIARGPTQQELDDAKRNILGSFPLGTSSNGNIVDYLGMIGFYNLPLDYLKQFPEQIDAVTVGSVKKAFARAVHPDRMLTVTVGPTVAVPAQTPTAASPAPKAEPAT